MDVYLYPEYWLDLVGRVLRSAAQGALLVWGVTDLTTAVTVPASPALLVTGAAGGALLALLMGVAFPAWTPQATSARRMTGD